MPTANESPTAVTAVSNEKFSKTTALASLAVGIPAHSTAPEYPPKPDTDLSAVRQRSDMLCWPSVPHRYCVPCTMAGSRFCIFVPSSPSSPEPTRFFWAAAMRVAQVTVAGVSASKGLLADLALEGRWALFQVGSDEGRVRAVCAVVEVIRDNRLRRRVSVILHAGMEALQSTIAHFYIVKASRAFRRYIQACPHCQANQVPRHRPFPDLASDSTPLHAALSPQTPHSHDDHSRRYAETNTGAPSSTSLMLAHPVILGRRGGELIVGRFGPDRRERSCVYPAG